MLEKVLVANRGEIACRVIRTCKKLGVKTVAIYSEADANARHVRLADEAVAIGPAAPAQSYLDSARVISAAREKGAQAIHPGYGFLSEDPDFAEACERAGIVFVGPTPDSMRRFALKHEARQIALECNVPVVPGTNLLRDENDALFESDRLGFPVLVKCVGGGGGIGMQRCESPERLREAFLLAKRTGDSYFGNAGVYLEKCVASPHHVEVQIFGDGKGNVIALGERECSIQRRYQKVLEEAGSPFVDAAGRGLRDHLFSCAVRLGKSVHYRSAGTVEFLIDDATEEFYFLEVNTRLQVEHAVTELVTGIDLVEWMLRQAAGEGPDLARYSHQPKGHAIEVRLYAEDPGNNYRPCSGVLTEVRFPEHDWARFDTWIETGTRVTSYYDPLLAKVIVHGSTREEAIRHLGETLDGCRISGIPTNLAYLRQVARAPALLSGMTTTSFLQSLPYEAHAIDVLQGGVYSTIQDYPGRKGYWDIGVPPSGPMDGLAFRVANRLVGNADNAAGLELTVAGPALRFNCDATIALTGARMDGDLDGSPVPWWTSFPVRAGSVLTLRGVQGKGCRAYMAIEGGLNLPDYLGSKATFPLGQFGGLQGKPLATGDVIPLHPPAARSKSQRSSHGDLRALPYELPSEFVPQYSNEWEIGVLYGPHGAPDFFTQDAIDTFFGAAWRVHHNSNRLGIRLLGPRPRWTRPDGGEAGLHPSNIHDCEYAIGSVNFTGDMPIVLTCDGPSLGGFVCPATIVQAEMWKIGQAKPNDVIRFRRMTYEQALEQELAQDRFLDNLGTEGARRLDGATEASSTSDKTYKATASFRTSDLASKTPYEDAVAHVIAESEANPRVEYRMAGDKYLLVEYGPMVLDLNLRFRVHALMEWLGAHPLDGVLELSPGVRSLQVHYDSRRLPLPRLLEKLISAEARLPVVDEMAVRSRILRLPFAFRDRSTLAAIEKYMRSVRPTAPYLPDNCEFVARINGLDGVEAVKQAILDASYLVLGLGDVYLGAPCAVPVDPRHRLVTSKYNPARMFTPEGAVGIGGSYMCIYGMESPGGYQLVGRTLPIWNTFVNSKSFADGKPWLLRFFDQVRFYPVTDDELDKLRGAFAAGTLPLDVHEEMFRLKDHNDFLASIDKEVRSFKERQARAFAEERRHWEEQGMIGDSGKTSDSGGSSSSDTEEDSSLTTPEVVRLDVPSGCVAVEALISGTVWDLGIKAGDTVEAGQKIVIVEAMKMELGIDAPIAGIVKEVWVAKGQPVTQGDILCVIEKPKEAPMDSLVKPSTERRRHPRYTWEREIWFMYENARDLQTAHSKDIAHGGMFIRGETPPLGAEVIVRMLADASQHVEFLGRVVRHAGDGEPRGFAVEFLRAHEKVESLVKELEELKKPRTAEVSYKSSTGRDE